MDILKENIRIQKANYDEIMEEYNTKYLKEYKEIEQKKEFFERVKLVKQDMEKQLEVINTDIDMLEHRRHQRDFRNQARLLEMKMDELHLMIKEFQFDSQVFNYKAIDGIVKGKEALNGLDFDGKTMDEMGQNKTVLEHKKNQIKQVDDHYDDAMKRLDNIDSNLDRANNQMKELSKAIRAQNIKLLEMDDLIRETQSVLARMTQLVEFFNKVFLKDKCMNLIILLMILLCVGCVVLIIMEQSKSGSTEAPAADATADAVSSSVLVRAVGVLLRDVGIVRAS